jgi:hypothetical protein
MQKAALVTAINAMREDNLNRNLCRVILTVIALVVIVTLIILSK